LRLGQTTTVELVSLAEDGATVAIPADGAVLSASGRAAGALQDLWTRVQQGNADSWALLRLEAPGGVVESLGGSPILVREGKRWFADVDDNFTRGRHPRTLVGWTPAGEALLVTVDGRQPEESVGMTLAEAADLLLGLGATEGINLDGGGSTTFVTSGAVANSPSDVAVKGSGGLVIRHSALAGDKVLGHVERPVADALAVVPVREVAVPRPTPLARPTLGLPQALALPAASATDPGSVPDGSLPALVSEGPPDFTNTLKVTAVAVDVVVTLSLLVVVKRRRDGQNGGGNRHRPTGRRWRDEPTVEETFHVPRPARGPAAGHGDRSRRPPGRDRGAPAPPRRTRPGLPERDSTALTAQGGTTLPSRSS
jgi:hypothetical protein